MRTPSNASSRGSAQRKLEASWLGLGCDDLLAIIVSALGVVAAVVLIFLYQEKGETTVKNILMFFSS